MHLKRCFPLCKNRSQLRLPSSLLRATMRTAAPPGPSHTAAGRAADDDDDGEEEDYMSMILPSTPTTTKHETSAQRRRRREREVCMHPAKYLLIPTSITNHALPLRQKQLGAPARNRSLPMLPLLQRSLALFTKHFLLPRRHTV